MITFFEITAILSLFVLIYIYVGYPVILVFLRYVLPPKKVDKKVISPDVSLLISCFNEERVIREKLENTLALDYPKDKLEIIVISDASTDQTDRIVREYTNKGVSLIRQEKRCGKTSGLNLAVSKIKGNIIIFSDANAMFNHDSIGKMVQNFNDEQIGYVVGEARYADINQTMSFKSENLYWQYEQFIKKNESKIHSVVGGDGAFYAIRRELFECLFDTDISDFVNPLQIILKGYRGVYEPEAICFEESAGDFQHEFQRKIRIVNRSFSGLMRMKSVLNPFNTGLFSFQVISHKLIRWFASVFILTFTVSCFVLALLNFKLYQWNSLLVILLFGCSYIGYLFSGSINVWKIFYLPYYFVLINTASVIGLINSFKGNIQTKWSHIRTKNKKTNNSYHRAQISIHIFIFVLFWFFFKITGTLFGVSHLPYKITYWTTILTIFYIYSGYPVILIFLSKYRRKAVLQKDVIPDVTLLICAYNEEKVIEEKIKNSFMLDYPPEKLKIVIASDGSTDRTNEIVKKHLNGRLALMDYPQRRGKMPVINDTISKLKSEIIVFSDANTMCDKDVIKKLVRNFNDPSIGGVSADVILHNEKTTFGKSESLYYLYERWIQKKESEFSSTIGADGGLYAIRRGLFVPPSSNIILDDFVISMNIATNGYRLIFDEEAIGHEHNTISYKTEFLRKSRVVAGAIQAVMQKEGVPSVKNKKLFFCYISHKFIRWLIPIGLIVLFFTNLQLVILSGELIYLITFVAQLVFYLLAGLDLFIDKNRKIKLILIPFYFCLVNGAALYGIYKGVFKKQSVKWQKFDR